MKYDFKDFKKRVQEVEGWFKDEIALLRTGRASPVLVENLKIDYYGAKNPLKSVATITVEDARTLRAKPWDSGALSQIEFSVRNSELGIQPVVDKDAVRIIFPELTEERRIALLKLLSEKLENARISLRREREEVWRDIQDKEREGEISEDDKYRHKDELQKIIDDAGKIFEVLVSKKEQEIKG